MSIFMICSMFFAGNMPDDQKKDHTAISFTGKDTENPKSPEKGILEATGTIHVPSGYTYKSIQIKYRPVGERDWIVEKVEPPSKEKPENWVSKLTKIDAGKYEVHATLMTKRDRDGAELDVATPDVRTVNVK